jgi:hypothetical protein
VNPALPFVCPPLRFPDELPITAHREAIAEALDISPRTVEIHRANLMEKMDAPSLSTVLRIAFAAGFGSSATP